MWLGKIQEDFLEVVPLEGFPRQNWDEERRHFGWKTRSP